MDLHKSFTVFLKDIYPEREFYTSVTVFYDCGELCAQPVKDEFGREWTLKELSIYDIQIIEENLVLQLIADENADASECPDEPWLEFERAEELVTIQRERYL